LPIYPVKAQELIQKIKMRAVQEKNGSKDPPEAPGGSIPRSNIPGSNATEGATAPGASPGSASREAGRSLLGRAGRRSASHSRKASPRQRRTLRPSEAAFFEWAGREWLAQPLSRDL